LWKTWKICYWTQSQRQWRQKTLFKKECIDKKVGEKITHTNIEGEHNDDEKDNLTFANDDDNINVNIFHLCFSYPQRKLSLMAILTYSLEAWKVCKKLDLEKFQFWFCLTIFLFLLHLKNLKNMEGV
jgi:hypothetical protein